MTLKEFAKQLVSKCIGTKDISEIGDGTIKGAVASLNDDLANVNTSLTASDDTPFRFGKDDDGNYGYIITGEDGADTVVPFNGKFTCKNKQTKNILYGGPTTATVSATWTTSKKCNVMVIAYSNCASAYPNTSVETSCTLNASAMNNNYGVGWYDAFCKICYRANVPAGSVLKATATSTVNPSAFGTVGAVIFTDE